MKKERPILFKSEMAKAVFEGRKTQTRRVKRLEFISEEPDAWKFLQQRGNGFWFRNKNDGEDWVGFCPYGEPGDLLWVKEAFVVLSKYEDMPRRKSSLHMPKKYCRSWLKVKNIMVERLHDISEEDAKAEGVNSVDEFIVLWNKINGKTKYCWATNPWVWVVEFRRCGGACRNLSREFIGFEIDEEYYRLACDRISESML